MCKVCVLKGEALTKYSFPGTHPLVAGRVVEFWEELEKRKIPSPANVEMVEPRMATDEEILLFHTRRYLEFVKRASLQGVGYLDYGDTPAFPGVYEAAGHAVGATLKALGMIMEGAVDHGFNPMGGLHHARRDRAGGFCVFNDAAIAIEAALKTHGLKRVLYVDIDAHHGDGVFYEFYDDPRVIIADIHEDGRYLYPGTGFEGERGSGEALGTKLNISMAPGSGAPEFYRALETVSEFISGFRPDLIILQCGADGLRGDPITHLQYTPACHRKVAEILHNLAHRACEGRILALGGGGYNIRNVAEAWSEVVLQMI